MNKHLETIVENDKKGLMTEIVFKNPNQSPVEILKDSSDDIFETIIADSDQNSIMIQFPTDLSFNQVEEKTSNLLDTIESKSLVIDSLYSEYPPVSKYVRAN